MNAVSAAEPLVRITDLHKGYGPAIQVLKGLNIEMKPGERVVVIGPSGGGKSTLLRVVMGLEEIQQGKVTFAGQPYIEAMPGRRPASTRRSAATSAWCSSTTRCSRTSRSSRT
jgi:ABC-type Fe3+/spermidine/putrescine transport system ATPase subunit